MSTRAAELEVRATGAAGENAPLNASPQMSFFVATYKTYFPFSRASIEIPVLGNSAWDSTVWIQIAGSKQSSQYDLFGGFYWCYHLPGIRHRDEPVRQQKRRRRFTLCDSRVRCRRQKKRLCEDGTASTSYGTSTASLTCDTADSTAASASCASSASVCAPRATKKLRPRRCLPKKYVMYVNSIANVITEQCDWQVGSHIISSVYGEYLEVYERFSLPAGQTTDETVGRYRTPYDLWCASRRSQVRYSKMTFSFCQWLSHAIPVRTIYWTSVQAILRTCKLENCWISSDGTPPYLMDCDSCLSDHHLKIRCWANVYHLCGREQQEVDNSSHEYLITQTQRAVEEICDRGTNSDTPVIMALPFKHNVRNLIWTVQALPHRDRHDWFNYSGLYGEDPITDFALFSNGRQRVQKRDARYFRTIEANEHHTRTPNLFAYCWNYCHKPENAKQPSGGALYGDNAKVCAHLWLQPGLGKARATFWADNYQLFRIKHHRASPAFG